jgi:3-oxoacyl-(acyl-carrier-protein) synthase
VAASVPVIASKANLGDSIDAGGLLQTVVALSAMRSGRAPPIVGLEEPEVPGLRYVTREASVEPGYALVTSTSHAGGCSALVLSVRHER